MIKGWLSFWSSCFPNFIYSWYVLYIRAGLPRLHCFREAGGNACACACVLPWLRDGACSGCCLLPSLRWRKWCFPNIWQRCQAPFRLPPLLPLPFHTRVGTGLAGAPVSSGAVDKGGQLTVCCRFLCLDSSRRAASGRESYSLWLFVIALSDFRKVVKRVNNQNTSEGVSLLCVWPAIIIMVFNFHKYSLYCFYCLFCYLGAHRVDNKLICQKKRKQNDGSILYWNVGKGKIAPNQSKSSYGRTSNVNCSILMPSIENGCWT